MVITYYGNEFLRVQLGDIVIAVNPADKATLGKSVKFGADIALLGSLTPEHGSVEQVRSGGKEPFIIDSAGEYEVRGVGIKGFMAPQHEKQTARNVIYMLELEGINLCFLSGLANPALPSDILQEIGEVDILFIPVGGGDVLSPDASYKLAVSLEPKMVIPTRFDTQTLKMFLKESGEDGAKSLEKLTVKKKDLSGLEAETVVLKVS